jgi:hypothetical protein
MMVVWVDQSQATGSACVDRIDEDDKPPTGARTRTAGMKSHGAGNGWLLVNFSFGY